MSEPQYTSVWSFPERGYRGNFAPQIARNIIEMYSEAGERILDPMVGGGTTLIEAKSSGRHALGLDINPKAVEITRDAINFNHHPKSDVSVRVGDARNLKA